MSRKLWQAMPLKSKNSRPVLASPRSMSNPIPSSHAPPVPEAAKVLIGSACGAMS